MKQNNKTLPYLFMLICFGIVLISSCKKDNGNAVADIDGNVYTTITIGTQVWMKENLKVTHYNNGDSISYITDASKWSKLKTGGYCNYDNDGNNSDTYGRLYNWYAISDSRNLAPVGWHIPTDAEWTILSDYLANNNFGYGGTTDYIGKSMAATSGWDSSDIFGTVGNDQATNNTSGFTALPGGLRNIKGSYYLVGKYGYWWCSDKTFVRLLYFNSQLLNTTYCDKPDGFSVRCIKD
jgi:uncharacterized protein (TIGR02145 family)